jgi:hypothetical protein
LPGTGPRLDDMSQSPSDPSGTGNSTSVSSNAAAGSGDGGLPALAADVLALPPSPLLGTPPLLAGSVPGHSSHPPPPPATRRLAALRQQPPPAPPPSPLPRITVSSATPSPPSPPASLSSSHTFWLSWRPLAPPFDMPLAGFGDGVLVHV